MPSATPLRAVASALCLALGLAFAAGCSGENQGGLGTDKGLSPSTGVGNGDASVGPDDAGGKDAGSQDAAVCVDKDEDGFGAHCEDGPDCDDDDPELHEIVQAYADGDGDGWGAEPALVCMIEKGKLPPGYAAQKGDCRDDLERAHPEIESDGCDDVDSDCDGAIDEDQHPEQTSCGKGVCARTGETACSKDGAIDSCKPGASSGDDTDCDNADNDCDGETDEGFATTETTCSTGVCKAAGMLICVEGATVDTCVPPDFSNADATCDGKDDDCDGQIDEDFAISTTSCGEGECQAGGQRVCRSGKVVDTCKPGDPADDDATCDRKDDDCDGETDEDYQGRNTTCGSGACADTGETSCVNGAVVDSCKAGSGGTSDTSCNGVDDDCNGQVDEDFVGTAESCGVGACRRTGTTRCVAGKVAPGCTPGAAAANDATCDGIDNDCNGQEDEDFAVASTSCGSGACARTGQRTCVNGAVVDSCRAGTPAANDATCDGVDNDCNGQEDEDFGTTATSCGQGACASTGTRSCVNGAVVDSCRAGTPAANDATCNDVDNDCNGQRDEDFVSQRTTCGQGACSATGQTSCVAGQVRDSCSEGAAGGADSTCDGIDSDCDGTPDDDYVARQVTCGVGACQRTGTTSCTGGREVSSCQPGAATGTDNDCDGIDDDCDGTRDDAFVSTATSCGQGVCRRTGATSCVNGSISNSCVAGPTTGSDNDCDGLDDDCDGTPDDAYLATNISCGTGACARTGRKTCVSGVESDSCTPGTPAASDSVCDGVDNDCNGQTDEDFQPANTTCGTGACAATGRTSCVNGSVSNSCTPGTPAANDATCNRVDNDCNGQVDEDFQSQSTTCGVGVCARTGVTSCTNGSVVDSCAAGNPSAQTDTTCDGRDDDCDGAVDDNYVSLRTSCGVGFCASTGATQCVSGRVQNTCSPRAPAAQVDASCNNVDDDCNGQVDEDYLSAATTCGVGACFARGISTCESGVELANCIPGTPASSDATCNGIDDDCSGQADEDFKPSSTRCTFGRCSATGLLSCVAGKTVDSCVPPPDVCETEKPICNAQQACGVLSCTGGACGCEALSCQRSAAPFCQNGQVCTAATQCGAGCDCRAPRCAALTTPVADPADPTFVFLGRDECGVLCNRQPRCSFDPQLTTCPVVAAAAVECGYDHLTGKTCGCTAPLCRTLAAPQCSAGFDGESYSCTGTSKCGGGLCNCTRCTTSCNTTTGRCNTVISRLTTQITTQIVNPQIVNPQILGSATLKARTAPPEAKDSAPPRGTISLFTRFFRWLIMLFR